MVPLGYELKDGKLSSSRKKPNRSALIFERYLELGSVNRLVLDLQQRDFRTKVRKLSTGASVAACSSRKARCSTCCGTASISARSTTRARSCPGPQPPLLDRDLFDAVQAS